MDKLTKYILDQLILYILTGSGILALFRAILWMQGLRIVSFYRVYRHRKDFYDHPVFVKIRNVIHARHFLIHIKDIAKKELAQDLIALEVQRIRQTLRENLKYIYKPNLFAYLKSYKHFRSNVIVNLFIKDYRELKEGLKDVARQKLTKNNSMTQEDFNKFWAVYTEYTTVYEMFIEESLQLFSERKNIYATLWDILDHFDALIEIQAKTIGAQLNIMNGRLSGIRYKGYRIE